VPLFVAHLFTFVAQFRPKNVPVKVQKRLVMRFMPSVPSVVTAGVLGILLLSGCQGQGTAPATADAKTEEHEAEEAPITEADVKMPESYAAAIPRIKVYREVIRTAVEAGKFHDAHRPLDELDIVLNKLIYIARDNGISKDYWETINVTARELRHLFNKIHTALDEGRTPEYAAISGDIDEAIGRLESVSPETSK
jgi:hypothetical protein